MHDDKFLEEYFQICKRIYEDLEREGNWPWESDSTDTENMIDSDSKSQSA